MAIEPYKLTDEKDLARFKQFKEEQKNKHDSCYGLRDVEDAFILGMEWQKLKDNK